MNAGETTTPKLGVQAATKIYHTASGDLLALDRCSLDIRANEIVSIVGPSGCGKTTLLWSMSGLHGLTSGEIRLDGKAITGPHPDIGIVFQEANLLPWRNLDANIRFPFEIKGEKPDRAWIAHLLNRVGLDGFGGKFPRELSGGMQQRAAIVRALALKPSVLLMDEPFGALDSFTREEMNRLVEEIWLDTKTTIVFITHSIEEAIFLSDRVVVLSARPGRVAKEYRVPFARPRSLEIMATKEVFDLTNRIKMDIVGERARPKAPEQERTSAEIVRIRP
ncbi:MULTISPECIES: ABC transporter ATP-binding protein [Mesorhizobium]|jgi:NitT/TauT family transport system ATP-binding protein|uniref:ABC transporter ATP-binding protein n=1 Tax=Rhizobium loti TaxID=381 RepID=A0A6M7TU55_RHILI|nr:MULTISPECIES: ABC transporter ATP-binding protein [Mesorhizobium]KRB20724.1 ABC transporter ATP-binding protein [Mesorhizobium sp. Root172]OBQ65428.1 ABC transporter ATP-binding protein [Mesorhizobium loti]QKC68549.1 ABC transporter ATP-binding protein [Mesorhizobium loti]QKC87861.1 ABC transporter ATP-binding protein [Mesorhizobium sp. NZP2234]BCG84890.1 ABC transporter ATP-binding protein [Mesorhizobium sp. 113-3-9]